MQTNDVDRPELIKLARELQRHADIAKDHETYAKRFDFAGYAQRILKAIGVEVNCDGE